jgi:hypothetical protein
LNNSQTTAFASSNDVTLPVLSGDIDIVVNLYSEFQETNNVPGHPYFNGLYEVGYFVEPADKSIIHDKKRSNYPVGVIPRMPLVRVDKTPNQWSYCIPDFTTADSDTMLRRVIDFLFLFISLILLCLFCRFTSNHSLTKELTSKVFLPTNNVSCITRSQIVTEVSIIENFLMI